MRWPLIRVTWEDSSSYGRWVRLDTVLADAADSMDHDSVGWLIDDAEDRITLAASIQTNEANNPSLEGTITIPKRAIVKRWTIYEAGDA